MGQRPRHTYNLRCVTNYMQRHYMLYVEHLSGLFALLLHHILDFKSVAELVFMVQLTQTPYMKVILLLNMSFTQNSHSRENILTRLT